VGGGEMMSEHALKSSEEGGKLIVWKAFGQIVLQVRGYESDAM